MMANPSPLEQIAAISDEMMERMKSLNIMSAEDLVSYYTATRDDLSVLMEALLISESELEEIIEQAKELIPEDVLASLTTLPPKDEMPFGALNPVDLKKNSEEED